MKFILVCQGKDGKNRELKCRLYIHTDRTFQVAFPETTPEVRLNDGNFYSLSSLIGVVDTFSVLSGGIFLERCFVNIDGKWHKDGFFFHSDR